MGKKLGISFIYVGLMLIVITFSACGGGNGDSSDGDSSDNGSTGTNSSNSVIDLPGGSKSTIEDDENAAERDTTPRVLETTADDIASFEGNGAKVDYSNASDGYIMAKYEGDNPKIKIQIGKEGSSNYTYDIKGNAGFQAFPLSVGSGNYNIAVFLNIKDDEYSQACAQAVQADLTDEFSPFLRPNQYSDFTSTTRAVAKGAEVAKGAKSDIKVVENVFIFVTENITYDYDKAATVQSGYIPNVDETLSSGTGICFDYASLTTSMLRTQSIPCQLVVGYAGTAYHAWISVHIEGVGWVANMIQFNGDEWTLMDPTFAASGDTRDPNVIGDGENYNPVYYY